MKRRLLAALSAAAIAILTGSTGAWAGDYSNPSPTPSETPLVEVTVAQPVLVVNCPDEAGVVLPAISGVDWYFDEQGPITTLDELNAIVIGVGGWSFTVTAIAQPGYQLVGVHEWLYAGRDEETCPPDPDPSPTPTSTPVPVPSGATATPPAGPTLPATGADPYVLAWIGLFGAGLIAAGIGAYRAGRRP